MKPLLIHLLLLISCKGISYEYLGADNHVNYEMQLPIGSTKAKLGFGIPTEWGYPVILVHFSALPSAVEHLNSLEIFIHINGVRVSGDIENFLLSHANKVIEISKADCCKKLTEKLGIHSGEKDDYFPLELTIHSKYMSLNKLPDTLDVEIVANTDKGKYILRKFLTKHAYKSSSYIRIH